ncbi:MAG TPA: S49 family peptidase, partial [Aggregatilineales bacterium]|nr:S49 family peptidase [Aggregatilineales bacterium]
ALIDDTYEGFLSIVAEGRSLPVDEVREIADGRVILGGDAVELGLVDELGYFEDAVAKAAELGGIEGEPRIVELKPQTGLFESLYGLESLMRRSEVLDLLQRTGAPPSLEFRYAAP